MYAPTACDVDIKIPSFKHQIKIARSWINFPLGEIVRSNQIKAQHQSHNDEESDNLTLNDANCAVRANKLGQSVRS